MAIIAPQTAPNFATGDYHRILKAELLCAPSEPVPHWEILVGFYASEAARQANPKEPLWVHRLSLSIEEAKAHGYPDPRDMLYDFAMKDMRYKNTNAKRDTVKDK